MLPVWKVWRAHQLQQWGHEFAIELLQHIRAYRLTQLVQVGRKGGLCLEQVVLNLVLDLVEVFLAHTLHSHKATSTHTGSWHCLKCSVPIACQWRASAIMCYYVLLLCCLHMAVDCD